MDASSEIPTAEKRSLIDVRLRRLHLHYRLLTWSLVATNQGKFTGNKLGDTEQGVAARV